MNRSRTRLALARTAVLAAVATLSVAMACEARLPTSAEVDAMTYMQLIRSAAESGLIADVSRFKDYRDKRNITSHTYNPAKAEEIVGILDGFVGDVRFLLDELERRNRVAD